MATKIQMRRGVESLWSKVDPILSDGEIAFIRDKNYIKVGDGEKTFNQLDKISGGSELIRVAQTSGDIELADNTQFVYSTAPSEITISTPSGWSAEDLSIITFTTSDTAPQITFPNSIGVKGAIEANKSIEISIYNNSAVIMSV